MVIIDNHSSGGNNINNSIASSGRGGVGGDRGSRGSGYDDDLDLDGSVSSLKKKRSVSFAPAGYLPAPSPAIPTTEITSPTLRSKGIIKSTSFSSNPLSAKGRPPAFSLDDEGGEENGAVGRGGSGGVTIDEFNNPSSQMFRNDDLL